MTRSIVAWSAALAFALTGCGGDGNLPTDADAHAGDIEEDAVGHDAVVDPLPGDLGSDVPPACGNECGGMIEVPESFFMMGCNEATDDECFANEKPYHSVAVKAFRIDRTEVTVRAYGLCVDAGACEAPDRNGVCNWGVTGRAEHPINCVTWFQARDYCAWAGRRLCSEAEWEKASRGTDERKFPWGDGQPNCELAVMNTNQGTGCGVYTTWPVGSLPAGASPYGVLDMAGNVWEWVEDDAHFDHNGAPNDGSAWVDTPRDAERMSKGGGFNDWGNRMYCMRASARSSENPDDPHEYYDFIGIRCCDDR